MYQVLARKWRPKTFKDVIGQDHVTLALANAVKSKKIAHAYLLTGTRGVGKTSIARIFAKMIRCQNLDENTKPCLVCDACLEIDNSSAINYIEIDGASNNGVDNIREIVENVQYLPTFGTRKVYVIDEVHMLSTGAFNALLKTLEEPPAHVTFIFATTDPHKLLGTVLSRCQRFDFKHVSVEKLIEHLENIIESEGIKVESCAILKSLAKEAKGSVRDSLSLLDQALSLSLNGKITSTQLSLSLGLASSDKVKSIITAMLESDSVKMSQELQLIIKENIDLKKFLNQVLDEIDNVVENIDNPLKIKESLGVDITEISLSEILWIYETLIKDFEWALNSFDPVRVSSLAFLKVTKRYEIFNKEKKKVISKDNKKQIEKKAEIPPIDNTQTNWPGFIKYLYKALPSIAMNLERARPLFDIDQVTTHLNLAFIDTEKLFFDIINEEKNKKLLKFEYAKYFTFEESQIELRIELISQVTNTEKKLQSSVEVEEKSLQDKLDKKHEIIKANKYIQEAQELFSSNVDKIIINKENEEI